MLNPTVSYKQYTVYTQWPLNAKLNAFDQAIKDVSSTGLIQFLECKYVPHERLHIYSRFK